MRTLSFDILFELLAALRLGHLGKTRLRDGQIYHRIVWELEAQRLLEKLKVTVRLAVIVRAIFQRSSVHVLVCNL